MKQARSNKFRQGSKNMFSCREVVEEDKVHKK
jgi:hypothetical protein